MFAAMLSCSMLKGGDTLIGDAEYLKKADQERLGMTVFIGRILPFFGKSGCVGFDFIPGECHVYSF